MKKTTPFKRLDRYALDEHRFKDLAEFQAYICQSKAGAPDYVSIDNLLYTMEEYDMAGRTILYQNRRAKKILEITTADRYDKATGFSDAIVDQYEATSWRNDIAYAD